MTNQISRYRAIVYSRCPLSLIDLLRSVEKHEVYNQFNFIVAYEDLPQHTYYYDKIQEEFKFLWRFDAVNPMLLNSYMLDKFKTGKYDYLYLRENARFIRPIVFPNDKNYSRRGIVNLKRGIYSDMQEASYLRYQHDFETNPSMNGVIIGYRNLLNFINGNKIQGHYYHFPYKSIEIIGDPEKCE